MTTAFLPMAERVKMARVEAKLTQGQVAELTGIDQANISRIERGKGANNATCDRILNAITEYLGHTPVTLEALDGVIGVVGRTQGRLVLVDPMAEPKPIEWLAEGFLARRYVTMIAGQEGAGKSAVTQTLAVALSTGKREAIGMRLPGKICRGLILDAENVMVVEGEEPDGSLAQSRLQSFGLTDENASNLTIGGAAGFDLDKDSAALDGILSDLGDIDYLVLDSFTSLWFGNENNVDDVRRVLNKLNKLAVKHNVGILLIHHTNKDGDAYRGTTAIGATIAAVFTFARVTLKSPETGKKEQHPTLRFLNTYKMRIAAETGGRMCIVSENGSIQSAQPTDLPDDYDTEEDGE